LFLVASILSPIGLVAAEPHPLVGTWKRVAGRDSKDGEWQPLPAEITMLKHITPTHVSWAVFTNENKQIVAAMGGTVEMDGDKYIESVDHALGNVLTLLGQKQHFTWKVNGNEFIQAGTLSNGVYLEERFERVLPPGKKTAEKP
jgi:hypothetical protein